MEAHLALFLALIFFCVALYFLPAIVAGNRGAENFLGILFLNFVLGWTVIVWVACFIWACVGAKSAAEIARANSSPTSRSASDNFVRPRPRL